MSKKFNTAFWKWFGDSKVVDKYGEPLVVYHGTGASFNKFKKTKCGVYSKNKYACSAFFFADHPQEASLFAESQMSHPTSKANVMPAYLAIQNPLVVDARGGSWWPTPWSVRWMC